MALSGIKGLRDPHLESTRILAKIFRDLCNIMIKPLNILEDLSKNFCKIVQKKIPLLNQGSSRILTEILLGSYQRSSLDLDQIVEDLEGLWQRSL